MNGESKSGRRTTEDKQKKEKENFQEKEKGQRLGDYITNRMIDGSFTKVR